MGWSCSAVASSTEQRISAACIASTGSSNTYAVRDGCQEFYELSGREYTDGRITGKVFRMVPNTTGAEFVCRFCIDGTTGRIATGPAWMRQAAQPTGNVTRTHEPFAPAVREDAPMYAAAQFPEFTRTNLTAPRVSIPSATLHFSGCDPDDQGHPHAWVWLPYDSGAVVNRQNAAGIRVAFAFRAYHDNPPAWVVDWGRTSIHGLTSYARDLLTALLLDWCKEQGDPLTMRAAEHARLQSFADQARTKAAEMREAANEADAAAEAHAQTARAFAEADDYIALCDGSRACEFVFSEALAINLSEIRANDKRDSSARRYGEPMPVHEHDFYSILRPFTGEWVFQPAKAAAGLAVALKLFQRQGSGLRSLLPLAERGAVASALQTVDEADARESHADYQNRIAAARRILESEGTDARLPEPPPAKDASRA